MGNNLPASNVSPEVGRSSSLRSWQAVVAVAVNAFAFVTSGFLPVGLLPRVTADSGVLPGIVGLMVTVPGIMAAIYALRA